MELKASSIFELSLASIAEELQAAEELAMQIWVALWFVPLWMKSRAKRGPSCRAHENTVSSPPRCWSHGTSLTATSTLSRMCTPVGGPQSS